MSTPSALRFVASEWRKLCQTILGVGEAAGVLWTESERVVIGRVLIPFTLNSGIWMFVPIVRC
jgi:hypothetical protein